MLPEIPGSKSAVAQNIMDKHEGNMRIQFQIIDEPKFDIRRGDRDGKLLMREDYWIYHLKTTEVYGGINKE